MAGIGTNITGEAPSVSAGEKKYRGVRQRKWGRWVSEIRLPNSRERIWLGSYDAPEKAARAFDAASVCLRGPNGAILNFPDSPPQVSCSNKGHTIDPQEIQAAATSHANKLSRTASNLAMPSEPQYSTSVTQSPSDMFISGTDVAYSSEEGMRMDWCLTDNLLSPVGTQLPLGFVEDFGYDQYFSMASPAIPEEMDEHGPASNSFLWNF